MAYVQPFSVSRWWTGPPHDHRDTATPTGSKLVIQTSEKKKGIQYWISHGFKTGGAKCSEQGHGGDLHSYICSYIRQFLNSDQLLCI